ncbi:MAG: helix-turn-helix transcriptional regulator [Gemmatimonadetes bacterium]|nr:helix-turn-helix transcriptional regulator [Gemmatimonadota bacterium]
MVFGLLERAGLQPVSGWPLKGLWIYFVVFYLVGRNVARRRYALGAGQEHGPPTADQPQWSQAELASRLEVSRQTVNAIEAGRYEPSLTLALKIARVFSKRVEEVFEL